MERTYVDIIGEYYDNQDEAWEEAYAMGLKYADFKKAFRTKQKRKKNKLIEG